MARSTQPKTEQAIKRIIHFYQVGNKSLLQCPEPLTYGKQELDRQAKQLGINPFVLRKARQFARTYGDDELKKLCRQIEKQGSKPGKAVFGISHAIRLLGVPASKRPNLQEEAMTEGWTHAELSNQISIRFGRRRRGGRKAKIPEGLHGLYGQIESLCHRWERWSAGLAESHDSDIAKMAPEVARLLQTSVRVMKQLHDRVTAELGKKWKSRKFAEEKAHAKSS